MRCLVVLPLLVFVACVSAASPALPVAAGLQEAVPVVRDGVSLLKEIAKVPMDVGEVLLLPMGVVECVVSPLPGVSFMSGLRHVGTGLLAPFCLVRDVLTLPYDAAVAVDRLCGHVVPGA